MVYVVLQLVANTLISTSAYIFAYLMVKCGIYIFFCVLDTLSVLLDYIYMHYSHNAHFYFLCDVCNPVSFCIDELFLISNLLNLVVILSLSFWYLLL